MRQKPLIDRLQMPGSPAGPMGKRRPIDFNALARIDLRLPIKRRMIGIFRDEHMSNGRFGRNAALDQPRRGRRLHDPALAGAARIFGSPDHEHPELRRHDIELLAHILADAMQLTAAARHVCRRHRRSSPCAADVPAATHD